MNRALKNRGLEVAPENRYFDPAVQAWAVKVLPGGWQQAAHDELLVATVGTGVALILWDKANRVAGLVHFMVHPAAPAAWNDAALPCPHAEGLLTECADVLGIGTPQGEGAVPDWVGFVVGGGTMLLQDEMVVGQANVMKAVDWLHRRKLPMAHYDVGQNIIRKVYFFPGCGELTVRRIGVTRNDTVRQREERYRRSLAAINLHDFKKESA